MMLKNLKKNLNLDHYIHIESFDREMVLEGEWCELGDDWWQIWGLLVYEVLCFPYEYENMNVY